MGSRRLDTVAPTAANIGRGPISRITLPTDNAMGRPALLAGITTPRGQRIELVTCRLTSNLLTFPGGAFSIRDEGLRARFGAYALFRRAAEAATVRDIATNLLGGQGQ